MGKLVISENLTLDGVMQSPGTTDVPFEYRGWAVDFGSTPEGTDFDYEQEVGLKETENAEAMLLGRVTFEAMSAFWPTAEGELAGRLNALSRYVVSTTLTEPIWDPTILGEDWRERVTELKEELEGEIVVYGSRSLSRALIEAGLVDEIRLTVYPIALGVGERLFEDLSSRISLRLVESRPLSGGVVSMVYAPGEREG